MPPWPLEPPPGHGPDNGLAPFPPLAPLSAEQRRVVEFSPTGGHVLVRAAPGSGKTETVKARIQTLVTRYGVAPEAILALTFSRRAATDLALRIKPADVWSGTFHAVSVDILEQWGAAIGIKPPLRIYAEERQQELLPRAIAAAGIPSYRDERRQHRFTSELKNRISRRKRRGQDEIDRQTDDDRIEDALVALVHETYCRLLAEAEALDFDDLITGAIAVLRTDLDAAPHYRARLRFVFVDEFHDISPEQFELVRWLAPARGGVQMIAIADPDQAIYDWRGADVSAMLGAFRREYRPLEIRLTRNFRSTGQIIAAANAVIGENRTSPATTAPRPADSCRSLPVDCLVFADEAAEADGLARLIQRAVASGRYAYGDIAVLYRQHHRSERAAAVLPQGEIPISRIEPGRFFRQPEVQEGLRYLELLLTLHDDHFVPALNWPRVLVDEVTMVHLRRLARREGTSLCDLARRIDDYSGEISPLARAAVRDFFATVAAPLGDLVEQPVANLIEPFLDVLRQRRSPIPREHRAGFRDTLDLLGRHLGEAEAALAAAIAAGRPIAARAGDDGDSAAALVILEHTLRCYLQRELLVAGPDDELPASAFVIQLGREQAASEAGCGLTVWETPHVSFSLGAQAWRLGQMLLMRYEQGPELPLVAFDLETGDRHPQTAEIVEIGALRLDGDETGDRAFARLVRPSGPAAITKGAGEIHGIAWSVVADQPEAAAVLPELLAFLDDAVLVGHNIEDFDYPILRRVARDQTGREPRHLLIDTHKMARRVLPDQHSYRLDELVRLVDPEAKQQHRAAPDIKLTARLFTYLRQQHRLQQEIDTLTEALPVVALSMYRPKGHPAGVAIRNDNALLTRAGARAVSFGQGAALRAAWRQRVGTDAAAAGAAWLQTHLTEAAADDQTWISMEERWRTALEIYSQHGTDTSLAGFLRYAALAEPIDLVPLADGPAAAADDPRRLGRHDRVTMMTVHSAKGLEWPLVFVLGVENDQFPHYRALDDERIAEERRLLYVGMTRARQRLCLIWARDVSGRERRLSPFLEDISPDIIKHW